MSRFDVDNLADLEESNEIIDDGEGKTVKKDGFEEPEAVNMALKNKERYELQSMMVDFLKNGGKIEKL